MVIIINIINITTKQTAHHSNYIININKININYYYSCIFCATIITNFYKNSEDDVSFSFI